MARTFKRKESLTAVSEINVTPLIDLAFALLIIFMITTPLMEQTIPVALPIQSKSQGTNPEEQALQVISIDKRGKIFWGKEAVTMQKLDDMLADLATQPDPAVIHLRGDGKIEYQKVIDVLDLIKKNKLTKLSLDTQVR